MRSWLHRGAFSIVELVVSVAIIALLLGILIPSLAGLRSSGRGAVCVSNLRQMSIAAQSYALEYGYLPPGIRYENDGVFTKVAWDWVTTFDDKLISPGALWDFTDDPDRVHRCPDYHGPTFGADPYTGYNYNTTYLGGESPSPQIGWEPFRPGARYSACHRTADVAVFGDGGIASGVANKFMRAPMNTGWWGLGAVYGGAQAFRHHTSTNVAYLDLHVAPVSTPFRGALATEALLDQMGYPANGFLSEDDRAYDPR